MVNITFKNVGQGDSIILEWEQDDVRKIGIIDCNLFNGTNPVLEYIIKEGFEEIEFLLLSHPHFDHFSGFLNLLRYSNEHDSKKKIKIHRFLHTASNTPDNLKTANRSLAADEELFKLFQYLKKMMDAGNIDIHAIDANPYLIIPLGNEIKMEFLSPSAIELDNFIRGVKYPFDEEEGSANPNANWLSTVIKLFNSDGAIVLTADAESSTLTRIGKKNSGRLGKAKLFLAQAPHHGSKGNLNKIFWQQRKRKEITPIVISVGKNGYSHPSVDVISFFDKTENYVVYSTNMTGALSKSTERTIQIAQILDLFSTEKNRPTNNQYNGDQKFSFSGSSCIPIY